MQLNHLCRTTEFQCRPLHPLHLLNSQCCRDCQCTNINNTTFIWNVSVLILTQNIPVSKADTDWNKDGNETSGCAMWFTAGGAIREPPKPLKIQVFKGSPSPQGSHSPYILRDTTRPRHVTYVQVSSKSDQRRLRKTLHKQTDKPTDTMKTSSQSSLT